MEEKHNFQRILIPLVLILQMPMNLTFIELLTHGRHKMDFRLPKIFNNVSGKTVSFIKCIFFAGGGGHTVALSFMGTSPWNQKSLSPKVLLAECCYETNITVLSLTFLIFRTGLIIPSL